MTSKASCVSFQFKLPQRFITPATLPISKPKNKESNAMHPTRITRPYSTKAVKIK
jgi:hypothetical protein